jgi:hypothetical protein
VNNPNFNRPEVNKKHAQVFIATTKGLVQILSITRLTASDLSSVATIAGTSQLAGISSGYQGFVENPQGVIIDVFGGHAYRLNLSHGIDQGESWQLGVFIAHYLFDQGCLSDIDSQKTISAYPNNNDVVIIATGKIDTISYTVLPIEALAKKCLLANSMIDQWQDQQKSVCFLAPSKNLREPLPDTVVNLTPIASLPELFQLCSMLGLAVDDLVLSKQIDTHFKTKGVLIEADFLPINNYYPSQKKPTLWSINTLIKKVSIKTLFFLSLILLALSLFSISLLNNQHSLFDTHINSNNSVTKSAVFALMGTLSDNKKSCKQGGVSILDEGLLINKMVANPTNLAHLCQLDLVTNTQVSSLWLVTDTKAIFVLDKLALSEKHVNTLLSNSKFLANSDKPVQWSLPLPSIQSQTRKYILLAFSQPSDAADTNALESDLYRLQQAGKSHTIEDLQIWINKTQANNTVAMLQHELTIQK